MVQWLGTLLFRLEVRGLSARCVAGSVVIQWLEHWARVWEVPGSNLALVKLFCRKFRYKHRQFDYKQVTMYRVQLQIEIQNITSHTKESSAANKSLCRQTSHCVESTNLYRVQLQTHYLIEISYKQVCPVESAASHHVETLATKKLSCRELTSYLYRDLLETNHPVESSAKHKSTYREIS